MLDSRPYNGALTREQFLFYEMRTTARLRIEGLDNKAIIAKITEDNLFQFPTERMVKRMAQVCVRRLNALNDEVLTDCIANDSMETAKQACLYAMMKDNRLVWEFMITVIGEKYRTQDLHFTNLDMNAFFLRLQEQDDNVATWTDSTIKKIKSVLRRVLIDNEYLRDGRSEELLTILISRKVENEIRANNEDEALAAFNCFM